MTVQIFQDPKDRQFLVIGSGANYGSLRVVFDIQDRCRPNGIIKSVLITQCQDIDRWIDDLRMISSYIKRGYELLAVPQTNMIVSFSSPVRVSGNTSLIEIAKLLGRMIDEPIKADRVNDPEAFKREMDIRNQLFNAYSEVIKSQCAALKDAARRD